jgi:hypothetical protein
MVNIPKDDEAPTGQHKQLPAQRPPATPARPPTSQSARTPTGSQQRPVTGQNPRPATDQNPQAPDKKKTGPVAQNTQMKKRSTQLLSLEPPKSRRGPALGKMNTRLDSMGGGATKSARNRNLFGGIGREKTGQTDIMPAAPGGQSAAAQRPALRKPGQKTGSVDLGASASEVDGMIARRKGTRRIPKAGGGIEGDAPPLESMGSGRRPAVDPGPRTRDDLPPVVNIPIPPTRQQPKAPPPDSRARGNTLAGVSAEDLLGDEGRQLLENMRRREQQTGQQQRPQPPRQQPNQALPPRTQDSSRQAFQSAEYSAELEQPATDDELRPQGSFLSGPTRQIQRDVAQTPMPAPQYEEGYTQSPPPPDDLGYERPVDFGEGGQAAAEEEVYEEEYIEGGTEEEPVARDSVAHDEMEQRAGYLLWLQGVITREEVEDALTGAEEIGEPVRDLLANSAFADQVTLYRFLARHESLAPVDLEVVQPTDRALASLRPAIARAYRVIPIDKIGELLLVAAAFPFDPKRLLELRRLTASKVKLFVVTEEEIEIALMKYYPGGAASAATLRSPKPPGIETPATDTENARDHASSVTGEGEALEHKYDPTLSGEDSGLYAPMDDPERSREEEERRPPSDVGMSELDDDSEYEGGPEEGPSAADAGDLDESTLGRGRPRKEERRALETGPEELDPFAE